MNLVCQHCDSDKGFYIKTQIYGSYKETFNSDGSSDVYNNDASDSLQEKRGKNAYCRNCNKAICKVSEIEKDLK